MVALRLEDVAPNGENTEEDLCSDMGYDTMDWTATAKTLVASGVNHCVIENGTPAISTE